MHVRLSAPAVWVAACMAAWPAAAVDYLTLDDVFARVADIHPELRLLGARGDLLAAERDLAALRPGLAAGTHIENVSGSGEFSGMRNAEFTLTLASVLERGGKLDARRTLAQSRIDALAVEREVRRLDLLAEAARRYLAVTAARLEHDIAAFDIEQRQRTVTAARRRLRAGASPQSVLLTAEAALARAELARARTEHQWTAARQYLAALWGEKDPRFEIAAGDPLALPVVEDIAVLAALLEHTPELARFSDERRIREARLRLARTATVPDLDWQVGVRRFQATGDVALIGGISLPLGARRRAGPEIRAAEAELASLEIEREVEDLSLYSTLTEAHGRYRLAQLEVRRLRDDVLPKLARAEAAAENAYRAGAASYLEWAQLQSERTSTRKRQLGAALDAQRALIEIQRLTGQPFVAADHGEGGKSS